MQGRQGGVGGHQEEYLKINPGLGVEHWKMTSIKLKWGKIPSRACARLICVTLHGVVQLIES